MNTSWEKFSLPRWATALDPSVRLTTPPMPPFGGSARELWPGVGAKGSLPLPELPIPSNPQGGLLGSLNAHARGGLLGRLAAPLEQRMSAGTVPANALYAWSVPHTPNWETVPSRPQPSAAQPFPEQASRSSWSEPEDGLEANGGEYGDGTGQILSDVTPDNYWIPGADYAGQGHHEFPSSLYKRMPRETQKVFDRGTSGQLYLGIDGRRHEYDSFHREYNLAIEKLLQRFMREQNITEPEQMTPDHARTVLKAIAESEEPRIRLYREFIRRLRLFYRLRAGGRGSE